MQHACELEHAVLQQLAARAVLRGVALLLRQPRFQLPRRRAARLHTERQHNDMYTRTRV